MQITAVANGVQFSKISALCHMQFQRNILYLLRLGSFKSVKITARLPGDHGSSEQIFRTRVSLFDLPDSEILQKYSLSGHLTQCDDCYYYY